MTTTQDIQPLLEALVDTREVVFGRRVEGEGPVAVWRVAAQDARLAFSDWCAAPGVLSHAAYLAAEDQADAALDSLQVHEEPRLLLAA